MTAETTRSARERLRLLSPSAADADDALRRLVTATEYEIADAAATATYRLGSPPPDLSKPRPRGWKRWTPKPGTDRALVLAAAIAAIERYRASGDLPLGVRQIGYEILSSGLLRADGSAWRKDNLMDTVDDVIPLARRAGHIDWRDVSDGATIERGAHWYEDGDAFVASIRDTLRRFRLDRRSGQPVVVEVFAETRGDLPQLIRPLTSGVFRCGRRVVTCLCRRSTRSGCGPYSSR